MTSIPSPAQVPADIELQPRYTLPIAIAIGAGFIAIVQPWIGLGVGIFGIFLSIQTVLIRLKFTAIALEVYRSNNLIRSFPYREWENWEIFWPPVPILFYFKEVNSIHFLPIIFDAKMLQTCLERYFPRSGRV
jgi:Protein of unknown function (DUF3119)